MQILSYSFKYNPKNLEFFSYDIFNNEKFDLQILLIYLWIITIFILIYFITPYVYWYILVKKEEILKNQNKNKIKELILMKEIQEELEQEMEKSLLNAALIEKN
jgi:hypothetical protein